MLFKEQQIHGAKYWHLIILLLVVVISLSLHLFFRQWEDATLKINDRELKVLVADNYTRWYKGLSNRKNLGNYDGMIFVFPQKAGHTMVMREMRFPLDIVWIDGNKVVDLAKNLPPEPGRGEAELTQYTSRVPANLVLELPAGSIEKNGINVGDQVGLIK